MHLFARKEQVIRAAKGAVCKNLEIFEKLYRIGGAPTPPRAFLPLPMPPAHAQLAYMRICVYAYMLIFAQAVFFLEELASQLAGRLTASKAQNYKRKQKAAPEAND